MAEEAKTGFKKSEAKLTGFVAVVGGITAIVTPLVAVLGGFVPEGAPPTSFMSLAIIIVSALVTGLGSAAAVVSRYTTKVSEVKVAEAAAKGAEAAAKVNESNATSTLNEAMNAPR